MSEKFKYSGELNKPIPKPKIGLLASEEQYAQVAGQLTVESYRRMIQLFDAHEIEHGNWEGLCFALARAHVPGFKIAKDRAGPKTKWDAMTRAELVLAVEATGIENITEAVEQLAGQEPWRTLAKRGGAGTLRDEYHRTKERDVKTLRESKAWVAHQQESEGNNL